MQKQSAPLAPRKLIDVFEAAGHRYWYARSGSEWSSAIVTIAEQPDTAMKMLSLGFHLFELCLDGRQTGVHHCDSMAKQRWCTYRPGGMHFVPARNLGEIELEGNVTNLHVMMSTEVMDGAKAEVFRVASAPVDVMGFNMLLDGWGEEA